MAIVETDTQTFIAAIPTAIGAPHRTANITATFSSNNKAFAWTVVASNIAAIQTAGQLPNKPAITAAHLPAERAAVQTTDVSAITAANVSAK